MPETNDGYKPSALQTLVWLQKRAWSIALRTAVFPVLVLFSRRQRLAMLPIYELMYGSEQSGLYPEVALGELIDRRSRTMVVELPSESYNVSPLELLALSALTVQGRPKVIFEMGTADGRTTINFAENASADAAIYTLNLPLEEDRGHCQQVVVGSRYLKTPLASRITQLWGNTTTFDYTQYLGRCQLIFIDADHSDAGAWKDSETAVKLVDRSNGVILWHDANRFGIRTALPRFAKEKRLPIYRIAQTNIAILCCASGKPVSPSEWAHSIGASVNGATSAGPL